MAFPRRQSSNVEDRRANLFQRLFSGLYGMPSGDLYADGLYGEADRLAYGVATHGGKEIDPLVLEMANRDPYFANLLKDIRKNEARDQWTFLPPPPLEPETLEEYTARQNIPTLFQGLKNYDDSKPVNYDGRVLKAVDAGGAVSRAPMPFAPPPSWAGQGDMAQRLDPAAIEQGRGSVAPMYEMPTRFYEGGYNYGAPQVVASAGEPDIQGEAGSDTLMGNAGGKHTYVSPVTGDWASNSSNLFVARRRSVTGPRYHAGNDLHAADGSPVHATIGGTILYAGVNSGYGYNVVVQGDDGNLYRYATHGPNYKAEDGTRVEQGQMLGKIGDGHLHFEVIPPASPAYADMVANPGSFISTKWSPGGKPLSVNPAVFFGIEPGTLIKAGQEIGTNPEGQQLALLSFTAAQQPREKIAEIQQGLAEQGLYTGKIDGVWGRMTQAGFEAFAKSEPGVQIRQGSEQTREWQEASAAAGATPQLPGDIDPETQKVAGVLYAEGRGEGVEGMQGVANVMVNRLKSGKYGGSLTEVLATPNNKQFAPPGQPDPNKPADVAAYQQALDLATRAKAGTLEDITGGALYFYNPKTAEADAVADIDRATAGGTSVTHGNHVFKAVAGAAPAPPESAIASVAAPENIDVSGAPAPVQTASPALPEETIADVQPAVYERPYPEEPPASYTPFTRLSPEQVAGYDAARRTPEVERQSVVQSVPPFAPIAEARTKDDPYTPPVRRESVVQSVQPFAPITEPRPMPDYPTRAGDMMVFRHPNETVSYPVTDPHDLVTRRDGVEGQLERQAPMPQRDEGDVFASVYGTKPPTSRSGAKDDAYTPPKPAPAIDIRSPVQRESVGASIPDPVDEGYDSISTVGAGKLGSPDLGSTMADSWEEANIASQPPSSAFVPFQPIPGAVTAMTGDVSDVIPASYEVPAEPAAEVKPPPPPSIVPEEDNPDKAGFFGRLFGGEDKKFQLSDLGNIIGGPLGIALGGNLVGGIPGMLLGKRNGGLFSFGQGPQVFNADGPSGTSPGGYKYQTGTGLNGGFAGQYTVPGGRTITYTEDDSFGQPGYMTGYSR